jgi:hypothetical protein
MCWPQGSGTLSGVSTYVADAATELAHALKRHTEAWEKVLGTVGGADRGDTGSNSGR